MFFECFRAHSLQISQKSLPLQRVFHSIRFKVNKRLGYGGIPFFIFIPLNRFSPQINLDACAE